MFCLFSLLNRDARALIARVKAAYNEYFGTISDDRLLAFLANPLFATLGSAVLTALLDDPVIEEGVPPIRTEGTDLVNKAKELFHAHVKHMLRGKFKGGGDSLSNGVGVGGGGAAAEGLCLCIIFFDRLYVSNFYSLKKQVNGTWTISTAERD